MHAYERSDLAKVPFFQNLFPAHRSRATPGTKKQMYSGNARSRLDGVIVIEEFDIAGSQLVLPHEFFVAGGSLVFVITRQHALYAHADTGDTLHRAPS